MRSAGVRRRHIGPWSHCRVGIARASSRSTVKSAASPQCGRTTTRSQFSGEDSMTKSDRPNMLVMWGEDIGISNLSCYSDGLMAMRLRTSTASTGILQPCDRGTAWGCSCPRTGSTAATRTRRSSSYSTTPHNELPESQYGALLRVVVAKKNSM